MWNRRSFLMAPVALALSAPAAVSAQESTARLSRKELKDLIANARTAADHQKLAAHFRSEQARHEEERTEHEELRKEYERNSTRDPSKFPTMGDHRRSLAQSAALSAKQAQAMAAIHEELARKSN